jgi:putative component of toxin-antitoxin plasmid stabilization module
MPQRRALIIVIERIQLNMIEVKTTPEFDDWMRGLRDGLTRRRLAARLRKAPFGLPGDIAKAQTLAQQLE